MVPFGCEPDRVDRGARDAAGLAARGARDAAGLAVFFFAADPRPPAPAFFAVPLPAAPFAAAFLIAFFGAAFLRAFFTALVAAFFATFFVAFFFAAILSPALENYSCINR